MLNRPLPLVLSAVLLVLVALVMVASTVGAVRSGRTLDEQRTCWPGQETDCVTREPVTLSGPVSNRRSPRRVSGVRADRG
jgi:hypothetical protein